MAPKFTGGLDIAIKVPPHEYEATVAFYRDVIGLPPIAGREPDVVFEFGPNRLWIDRVPTMTQAEVWLELFCDDSDAAIEHLEASGVVRCDAVEPLGNGFRGAWFTSPSNIVHMVREADAW
jgi:hypothetical protein